MNFIDIKRLRKFISEHGALVALVVLLVVCALSSADFRRPQNLLNILRQNAYTGIIAIGMTFIIIGGGIDLSVGSLFALAGGLGILAMNALPVSSPVLALTVGILVALVVGLAGGALNGALVTLGKLPPFIATLGTMSIYRSLILHLGNAGLIGTSNEPFSRLDAHKFLGLNTVVWLFLFCTALGSVVLYRTRYGRHLCAVGGNERVARYAAIRVNLVKFISYTACGLLCGVSALLQGARLSSISSSSAGAGCELDAIAIAIIGGTSMAGGKGTIWGAMLGAMILGIISNILVMWSIAPNLQGLIKGLVIIVAVLIQRGKK